MTGRFSTLFVLVALVCGALPACASGGAPQESRVLVGERLLSKRIVRGDLPVVDVTSISYAFATEGALMVVGSDGAAR